MRFGELTDFDRYPNAAFHVHFSSTAQPAQKLISELKGSVLSIEI